MQLAEEQNSIQPIGNEAANAELMDQILNEINTGSGPGPDAYANLKEEIIPDNSGIQIHPEPDKPDDSDYLNNSHNIVNEDWLESIGKGGRGASEKNSLTGNEIGSSSDDEDPDHIISTSSKKKEKKSKKKTGSERRGKCA